MYVNITIKHHNHNPDIQLVIQIIPNKLDGPTLSTFQKSGLMICI